MQYSVIYPNWAFFILAFVLGVITLFTAAGNILVFAALFRFKRLRSTSNLLIGNLAISDFLLAITVLPFSSMTDATGLWLFGSVLCDIWLVIDVLYCTASVWSLVVIAFDRFTATTFPVWYRGKQTKMRVLCYIILVWILSGLICLPGLLGWGYKHMEELNSGDHHSGQSNQSWPQSTSTHVYNPIYQGYECVLFTEAEYIVYSALGSFIIPLFIMIGLYARIFVVLKARSRLHQKNHPKVMRVKSQKSQDEESLEITEEPKSSGNKIGINSEVSDQLNQTESESHSSILTLCSDFFKCKHWTKGYSTGKCSTKRPISNKHQTRLSDLSSSSVSHLNNEIEQPESVYELEPNQLNGTNESSKPSTHTNQFMPSPSSEASQVSQVWVFIKNGNNNDNNDSNYSKCLDRTNPNGFDSDTQLNPNTLGQINTDMDSRLTCGSTSDKRVKKTTSTMGAAAACRKQSRATERADQRERRATKRMALIMLIFVICWIPFTLMYLIRGLCGESKCPDIPDFRKFVTWLGYVNSTINPVLYAMFNKEYRHAFAFLLGCRERKTKR